MNTSESDCQDLTDQVPKSNIFFALKSWQWLHYPSIDSEFSEANMFKSNTHMPSHSEDLSGKHLGLSGKYMLCLENLRFADIQNDDYDKLGKKFCNENRCWLYLWVCSCTNLNMPVQCTICGQNYFLGKRTQIQPSNAMLEEDVRQTMWICKVLFPAWTYSVLLVVVFKSTSWSFN